MERKEALELLKNRIKNKNLIKHSLSVEACLNNLAERFKEDKEIWGLAGLLHDLDYEDTEKMSEKHGLKAAEELEKLGVEAEIIYAVKAHNETTGTLRKSNLDKAIYAVDPLTGLIVASALVQPDKKLAGLKIESVLKKFKQKSFAAGARRETILACRDLGLELEEFVRICLEAMQGISSYLGL